MVETRRAVKHRFGGGTAARREDPGGVIEAITGPDAFDQAKRYAQATVASKRFEVHNRTPEGFTIYRFWTPGEQLTGTLGESNGPTGYGETSYPILRDDGSVICVPGNRRLVKAFRKAKAFFQRITITYLGKLNTSYGHYEKAYSVELSPLGKEGAGRVGREILAQAAGDAKRVLKLAKTE